MKKSLLILFLICVGVVAGTLISSLTASIPWLNWLSFGSTFGLTSPFILDLGVIQLTFGLTLKLSVAVIL